MKKVENRKLEEMEEGMSHEEGDRDDGEEELAPSDWRVRAGPRDKPIQKERELHEATHVPFRDGCAHCMMGRRRTHHHLTEQKSQDQPRRPTTAMDHYFVKMKSFVHAQTVPEEAVTCIAVKDRHQNIMSSVALKKESKNREQLREW